jgi:prevent-host-death family protein
MCYMMHAAPARQVSPEQRSPMSARRDAPAQGRPSSHVGVRELRQNLSIYLDQVKQGASLTVTEHGRVVALLTPLTQTLSPLERLIAEGRATPATRSLRDVRPRRLGCPDDPASEAVISDMREDRL